MPNALVITITSVPVDGNGISFSINIGGNSYSKQETFRVIRDSPQEVEIGDTLAANAYNLQQAIIEDYGNDLVVELDGNTVTVFSINGYMIENVSQIGSFSSMSLNSIGMAVSGLSGNRYLINNDIFITFAIGAATTYYDIIFENLFNQKQASARIYANASGQGSMYISATIKSLFEYPSDTFNYVFRDQILPNANMYRITISTQGVSDYVVTKLFVRGGNRTNDTNQTIPNGVSLRPTVKLPVWAGYDTADYVITGNSLIKKILADVEDSIKDYQRKKGCNEVYVKFLNQQGGYCHWLFSSHEDSETGGSDGAFVRNNKIEDLGGEAQSKRRLFGKIPEYYKGYINDLVVSPEVYALRDGKFERVSMSNNTFVYDRIQRAYNVKINIEFNFRFNPSLIWSS